MTLYAVPIYHYWIYESKNTAAKQNRVDKDKARIKPDGYLKQSILQKPYNASNKFGNAKQFSEVLGGKCEGDEAG